MVPSSMYSTSDTSKALHKGITCVNMDEVQACIQAKDWERAIESSQRNPILINYVHKLHLISLLSSNAASASTAAIDVTMASLLGDIALYAVEQVPGSEQEESQGWIRSICLKMVQEATQGELIRLAIITGLTSTQTSHIANQQQSVSSSIDLLETRRLLLLYSDRFDTYEEIWGLELAMDQSQSGELDSRSGSTGGEDEVGQCHDYKGNNSNDDELDAAGWGDIDLPREQAIIETDCIYSTRPSLRQFLDRPLHESALELASLSEFSALLSLCLRHSQALWTYRFMIISAIPEWEDPVQYLSLLPGADERGTEKRWLSTPWRTARDWSEPDADQSVVFISFLQEEEEEEEEKRMENEKAEYAGLDRLMSSEALSKYYLARIEATADLGLVSIALLLVQHSASLGILGLGHIGEELSLLSKLVYDRPSPLLAGSSFASSSLSSSSSPVSTSIFRHDDNDVAEACTLSTWRSLSTTEIIRAYLLHSTPASLLPDIRRLVFPYLSVLESRLERAGTPDSSLRQRHIYEYLLNLATNDKQHSNNLSLVVALFEASKPTLRRNQRIISSDEDLARLSIACLYGCKETSSEAFTLMGKIFECLPAFEGLEDPSTDCNLFQIFSVSSTVNPNPTALFDALQLFPASSLSTTLDALDLHLATAETFSRYSIPAPLEWFLTSHLDTDAQRAHAIRMSRAISNNMSRNARDAEEHWAGLMEDMISLTSEVDDEDMLRKAFWRLSKEEVVTIFFSGLLASGNFLLARSILHPTSGQPALDPITEESLVIAASREFYDSAESGNLHKGAMKLAFEVLNLAPPTSAIRVERDFIEATSRLCSFKIQAQPGVPLAPIEIRSTKDRLSFISRLLASNEDAYRHPEVILELVDKLGYRLDSVTAIRALAMIADSGLQAEDYERAADTCDRMFSAVQELRKKRGGSMTATTALEEAAEIAWRNCFQLGKHEDFGDLRRRMRLLGHALILCPSQEIATLLPVWTSLELRDSSTKQEIDFSTPSVFHLASTTINPIIASAQYLSSIGPAPSVERATKSLTRAAAYFQGANNDGVYEGAETVERGSRMTAGGFADWLIGADQ